MNLLLPPCLFILLEMLRARGPYRRKYDSANTIAAVSAVKEGIMSFREAAAKYAVPKTTIHDRVKGKVEVCIRRSGPASVLTQAEEQLLMDHILACGKIGYPLSKKDVKLLVKTIITEDGRENPFTESMPGTV